MRYTSIDEIKHLVSSLGLKKKDVVLVHSSLLSLGKIENSVKGFYKAIRDVIGEEGTIIVPTFTYSFRRNEVFDQLQSPSPKQLGPFSEFIRTQDYSIRSQNPLFSFSANGPLAKKLVKCDTKFCFGENSIFRNFEKENIKIFGLGITYTTGITSFIHIEKLAKVPYRFDKKFKGYSVDKLGNCKKDFAIHFLKKESFFNNNITCREAVGKILEISNISKSIKLGSGNHFLINFKQMVDKTYDILSKDPYFMIKGKK